MNVNKQVDQADKNLSLSLRPNKESLETIHQASLAILNEIGLKIYSPHSREILASNGAVVENEVVRFPSNLVNDAIDSAPDSITMVGRDPKKTIQTELGQIGFTNFGEALCFRNPHTKAYGPSTKNDLSMIIKMADAMDELDFAYRAVASRDQDSAVQPLHNMEAVLNNTGKHFFIGTDSLENGKKMIEMAQLVAGGKEKLSQDPIFSFMCCPLSPLQLTPECSDVIVAAAQAGVPAVVVSEVMAGATSPASMGASVVQHNAEVLGGIVLSQCTQKGAPVIYGSTSSIMDMRFASCSVGCPELGMFSAAFGMLSRNYRLPSMMAGG
jgi:trimethylamine---corrinoid protein Co-methyltransferase